MFDGAWREESTLADGTRVVLRLLRREDAPLLQAGFDKLSPESRYRRFLSARTELGEEELRYLTELDGENHFAIGVQDEHGEGLGVARFVRLAGEPKVAEAAVTVVDGTQGKGLGRLLLQRLALAADERGVEWFRCEVLASNEPMRQLLAQLAPEAKQKHEGEVVRLDVPIAQLEAGAKEMPREHPLYRLFIGAAAGVLVLRGWLAHRPKGGQDGS